MRNLLKRNTIQTIIGGMFILLIIAICIKENKIEKKETQNIDTSEQCEEGIKNVNLMEYYYGSWKVTEYIPLAGPSVEQTFWKKEHYYGRTVEITENTYTKSIYYWPDELASQTVHFDFGEVVEMADEDIWITHNARELRWLDGEYFSDDIIKLLMFYQAEEERPEEYCAVSKDNEHLIVSWLGGRYLLERYSEQDRNVTWENICGNWVITRLDSYDNIFEGHVKDTEFIPDYLTEHLNLSEFYAPDWFGKEISITNECLESDTEINGQIIKIQSQLVDKEQFEEEQGIHDGFSLNNEKILVYQINYGESNDVLTIVPVNKNKIIIHIEMGWFVLEK